MRYRLLGRSGLRASEFCLGTATFTGDQSGGVSKAESARIFEAFAEAGGNFVDTSNRYGRGTSEDYVGEFAASDREWFVLASKYTLSTRGADPNASGNHRKSLVQALEASLKRLRTDYVDLYLVHAWDFTVPVEELMRALDDAVRAGKVLHVGISNAPAWVISRANTLAEMRGWTPFVNVQVEYSLIQREPERELLPMARDLGMGVTAYSPLGAGWLAGERGVDPVEKPPEGASRLSKVGAEADERNARIAAELHRVAEEVDRPVSHVALGWLRQQPNGIIPIVGAQNAHQLKENLACLDLRLSVEQLERLDEMSRIEPGYPHDILAREDTRERVYGDLGDRLDLSP
jgi:aryl-alcohol dehydrogenase-like predicted oxidoreductase